LVSCIKYINVLKHKQSLRLTERDRCHVHPRRRKFISTEVVRARLFTGKVLALTTAVKEINTNKYQSIFQ
jgi:hypothetical protein